MRIFFIKKTTLWKLTLDLFLGHQPSHFGKGAKLKQQKMDKENIQSR